MLTLDKMPGEQFPQDTGADSYFRRTCRCRMAGDGCRAPENVRGSGHRTNPWAKAAQKAQGG
jgi:hypothetical protein